MIKFQVLPKQNMDISNPENFTTYANFLAECNELSVQLSIQNIQGKLTTIFAEPTKVHDYEEIITFIDKYFFIQSIEIDRIEKTAVNTATSSIVFADTKLNQLFALLAKAIQKCIDNSIPANGYLLSAIQSIDARLESTVPINFNQFDIVDFNFGTNMPYELSGGHIWTIVIQKTDNESLIIPLIKNPEDTSQMIPITENDILIDISAANLTTTYISVRHARWVSNLRANKVLGKAQTNFIPKICAALSDTFNNNFL